MRFSELNVSVTLSIPGLLACCLRTLSIIVSHKLLTDSTDLKLTGVLLSLSAVCLVTWNQLHQATLTSFMKNFVKHSWL